jgi:hypothetical protein
VEDFIKENERIQTVMTIRTQESQGKRDITGTETDKDAKDVILKTFMKTLVTRTGIRIRTRGHWLTKKTSKVLGMIKNKGNGKVT